jgi:hypothetical protein
VRERAVQAIAQRVGQSSLCFRLSRFPLHNGNLFIYIRFTDLNCPLPSEPSTSAVFATNLGPTSTQRALVHSTTTMHVNLGKWKKSEWLSKANCRYEGRGPSPCASGRAATLTPSPPATIKVCSAVFPEQSIWRTKRSSNEKDAPAIAPACASTRPSGRNPRP